MKTIPLSRRSFLIATGLTAGGLMLGWQFPNAVKVAKKVKKLANNYGPVLDAYLQITEEGIIKIIAPNPEIGQGVKTAMPMIIAEELEADWNDVRVEQGIVNDDLYPRQAAVGSGSILSSWERLRMVGATTKEMLLSAAAKYWQVPKSECQAKLSRIIHKASQRELTYGQLSNLAGEIKPPSAWQVKLKDRKDFTLLGSRIGGVDNLCLVKGEPLFGIDQHLEDMVYATYVKCPRLGGKPRTANLDEIKQLSGVLDAFIVEGSDNLKQLQHGVAIVAQSSWSAFKAREKLVIEWDYSQALSDDLLSLKAQVPDIVAGTKSKRELFATGNVSNALNKSAKTASALYSYPFLAHAPLEPMNCTVWLQGNKLTIWAPTQRPQKGKSAAAITAGIPEENIEFNLTRIGGGFGRRLQNDYIIEGVAIAKRVKVPVHYISTREEDTTHDYYRPGGFIHFHGGIDKRGHIKAWREHFITYSSGKKGKWESGRSVPEFPAPLLDNFELTESVLFSKIPTGAYRAPVANGVAFPLQSFLHELSVLAQRDHLEFLLSILGKPQWLKPGDMKSIHTGRAAGVLKLAAEKANWSLPKQAGRGRGISFYFSYRTPVAEVVELSIDKNKKINIHNVIVAADAGPIVNLSAAESQCQGAVLDALSSVMGQEITFSNGAIEQTNFHDYPLQRMPGTPNVDVYFIESDFAPTGLGEPALPPFAAALCNAIYDATGERIRELPLSKSGYSI